MKMGAKNEGKKEGSKEARTKAMYVKRTLFVESWMKRRKKRRMEGRKGIKERGNKRRYKGGRKGGEERRNKR